jgi:hypothetical protein
LEEREAKETGKEIKEDYWNKIFVAAQVRHIKHIELLKCVDTLNLNY